MFEAAIWLCGVAVLLLLLGLLLLLLLLLLFRLWFEVISLSLLLQPVNDVMRLFKNTWLCHAVDVKELQGVH